jgi:hypothetical protein
LMDAEKKIQGLQRIGSDPQKDLKNVRRIEELEMTNAKLSRALEDAENKIRNNDKKRRDSVDGDNCKDHREKLIEMAKSSKIIKNALTKAEKKVKDLEDQLADSGERIMNSYNTDEKITKYLQDSLDKAEVRIKELELKNTVNGGESSLAMRMALDEKDKKIEMLENKSLEDKEKLESKIRIIEDQKNALENDLNIYLDTSKKLKEKMKEKQNQLDLLKNEHHVSKNENAKLNEKVSKLDQIVNLIGDSDLIEKLNRIEKEVAAVSTLLKTAEQISKSKDEPL